MPNETPTAIEPDAHDNHALHDAQESPRYYHRPEVYDVALGEVLEDCNSILEVGSGNGALAQSAAAAGKRITLVDPSYAHSGPEHSGHPAVAALGQELPFQANTFDAAVSVFTLQHLSRADQSQALREMVRVTRAVSDEPGNPDRKKGVVIAYPVFGSRLLRQKLASEDLSGVAMIGRAERRSGTTPFGAKWAQDYEMLLIHKTAELTEERLNELLNAVAETNALSRNHRSFGEMAVRATQRFQDMFRRAA